MSGKSPRHTVRGLFAGLFLGLGAALMLFVYGVLAVDGLVLAAFAVGGMAVGAGLGASVPTMRAHRAATRQAAAVAKPAA